VTVPLPLPDALVPVMGDFVAGLRSSSLPVLGAWVFGSVALGAFDPATSDVDITVVINRHLRPGEVAEVAALHAWLAARHTLGARLDAQYLTLPELRGEVSRVPGPLFRDGTFRPAGGGDLNAVTRWLLAHRGLTLLGPEPDALAIPVTWDDVREAMRFNLEVYWAGAGSYRSLPGLLSDEAVRWTVGTLCRIVVTLREDRIVSKAEGVAAVRSSAPGRWGPLLDETARLFGAPVPGARRPSRVRRAWDARAFAGWARREGLALLGERP
jgi:predicted nucleotidyltransferase